MNVVEVKKPEAGHDVQLTIDLDVAADRRGVARSRAWTAPARLVDPDSGNYYAANGGAVVVLDARTGVGRGAWRRTRASTPTTSSPETSDQYFDPNAPAHRPCAQPLRAGLDVQDVHLDGDAAEQSLPEGANHVETDYPTTGASTSATTRSAATRRRRCYGTVDLPSALTVSSDVYFYNVGNEFWNRYRDEGKAKGFTGDLSGDKVPDADHPVGNAIQHTARAFGFGEPTGIGLAATSPASIPDLDVPDQGQPERSRHTSSGAAATAPASRSGRATCSSRRCSSPNGYAAFANGGTLYTPAARRRGPTQSSAGLPAGQLGTVVHTHRPPRCGAPTGLTPGGARPDRSTASTASSSNEKAPRSSRSTTTRASTVAGKTGTAQAGGDERRTRRGSRRSPTRTTTPRCRSTWSSRWSSRVASAPTSPRRSSAGSSTTSTEPRSRPPVRHRAGAG